MKITDVRLRKVNNQDNRMKALVSITFDDSFVIHDLRVIEGNNGMFVAMPSKRTPDGEFRDIAHPIHSDMRQHVQEEVMKVYEESETVEQEGDSEEASESENEDDDDGRQSVIDPSEEKTVRDEPEEDR
ncbi:septation regulator SpoVG [Salinicoccus albus]|uniref:septation regulator SpoVG n=1 Tax=Salinicoccus albus TaxID=418756 RepID=UPI00037EFBE3|nr:septation regulator SpoVG [Salinicoccus albus]